MSNNVTLLRVRYPQARFNTLGNPSRVCGAAMPAPAVAVRFQRHTTISGEQLLYPTVRHSWQCPASPHAILPALSSTLWLGGRHDPETDPEGNGMRHPTGQSIQPGVPSEGCSEKGCSTGMLKRCPATWALCQG